MEGGRSATLTRFVILSLGLIAGIGVDQGPTSGTARQQHVTLHCPIATARDPYAPEHLAAAIRREVPRAYRGLTNQAGKVRLTPRTYDVDEMLSLAPTYPRLRGASFYRKIAARRCGHSLAERSWVVLLGFPTAQTISGGRGVAFFARTARGWRLWYRYQ